MQAENTASSKSVRLKTKAIVDSKLAGEISKEQYVEGRKLASEEAAEVYAGEPCRSPSLPPAATSVMRCLIRHLILCEST